MMASQLLIALAAGYAVLALSNKQERPLDALGRLIGGLILIVSFIGLICVAVCSIRCHWAACHGGSAMSCPYSAARECPRPMSGGEQPPTK